MRSTLAQTIFAAAITLAVSACTAIIGVQDFTPGKDAGSPDVGQNTKPDAMSPHGDSGSQKDAGRPDSAASCAIAGDAYQGGAANPTNTCQSCQPAVAMTGWSNLADGSQCGSGGICHTGACVNGCEVAGVYSITDGANPNDPCQTCQPTKSTSAWSNLSDGTSCGSGQLCSNGECGTQCSIGGMIYPTSTKNPKNSCQSCQPGTSDTAWTNLADGTACGTGGACAGGTCITDCSIGGTSYPPTTVNPTNTCQSCQPSKSATMWSSVTDGTVCGAGTCMSGACTGSVVFNYTGAEQDFVVPLGVTVVTIVASGAAGGEGYDSEGSPGSGGMTTATIPVTPGETLAVFVGEQGGSATSATTGGTAAFNGGGVGGSAVSGSGGAGGGASDVRQGGSALGDRVVVAGGGGGAGGYDNTASNGGEGGPATGGSGVVGGGAGGGAGGGGTPTGGGGGGAGVGGANPGIGGVQGTGGAGGGEGTATAQSGGGGGGGGGYFGGGGGGASGNGGGGGGGGASYVEMTATSTTLAGGTQTANGQVVISF